MALNFSWIKQYRDGQTTKTVTFTAECVYSYEPNYSDTHARLRVLSVFLAKSSSTVAVEISKTQVTPIKFQITNINSSRISGSSNPRSTTATKDAIWSANSGGTKTLLSGSPSIFFLIKKTPDDGQIETMQFRFSMKVNGDWGYAGTATSNALVIPHKPDPPANLYGVLHSAEQLQGSLSAEEQMKGSFNLFELPEYQYEGSYEFTPSSQTQYAPTAYMTCLGDIKINPIPSNYGLITYDGTVITVS